MRIIRRLKIELEDAIRCAKDGDALLFVGAGLSFLASRKNGERVPNAADLCDLLLQQPLGTGSKHPLDRVAGAACTKHGVDFIFDQLVDNFTVDHVDQRLHTLHSLPWKRIYTTNYDNSAELARSGAYPISSITVDENSSAASVGSIIHLNGYIKRISAANLQKTLLLTDASYAAARLLDTGWLSFFERDLNSSRAIIFAGYSLYDLDIDRVLFAAQNLSRKAFFFIAPDADEIEIETLERYGTVIHGGIDVLVKTINEVSLTYTPSLFPRGFTALRELTLNNENDVKRTSAEKIVEQLVYGQLPEPDILAGLPAFDDQTFLVVRKQDLEAQSAIHQGPWRDVLFVGELASGKSASTLTLSKYLLERGYRVFFARQTTSLTNDLQRLATIPEKIAVIFDGYSDFRRDIDEYAGRRPATHRIIMAERFAVHELIGGYIASNSRLGPVREIALDKIDTLDAPAFEALTNFGGFWGERAGAGRRARENYITRDLDGSLYRLLIEIFKSENIKAKLRELVTPLYAEEKIVKAFCSILIVNSLRFIFTTSEWQYLFDGQLIRRMLSVYSDQVRHFMISDLSHVYVRNGLLSSHILHAFTDDALVRQCLVSLYERADRGGDDNDFWHSLSIELTKFSSIEPMLSGSAKKESIFQYYDEIRVYGDTRNNPDYWLQLGIAATALDDLPRGTLCFKNAYARERAKKYPNLTRIDNYFSRFQMKEAAAETDANEAFKKFIAANDRLRKQIFLDTNRHYPFKTGRHFTEIAAKHFSAWNETQKSRFKEATKSIKEKAEQWKANKRGSNSDVELLIRETASLLQRL